MRRPINQSNNVKFPSCVVQCINNKTKRMNVNADLTKSSSRLSSVVKKNQKAQIKIPMLRPAYAP